MAGPAAVRIVLSELERGELEARARRRKIARADAVRAEIVLLAADGLANCDSAEEVGVSRMAVLTWRKRFNAPSRSSPLPRRRRRRASEKDRNSPFCSCRPPPV
jgi:hypothetical protein